MKFFAWIWECENDDCDSYTVGTIKTTSDDADAHAMNDLLEENNRSCPKCGSEDYCIGVIDIEEAKKQNG